MATSVEWATSVDFAATDEGRTSNWKDPRIGRDSSLLKNAFIDDQARCGKTVPPDFFDYDKHKHDDGKVGVYKKFTREQLNAIPRKIQKLSFEAYGNNPNNHPQLRCDAAQLEESFYRTWRQNIKEVEEKEAATLKDLDCKCSETAIEFYNKKHRTNYKVVETIGSYSIMTTGSEIGYWYHCNFRAVNRDGVIHEFRPLSKLFFAELHAEYSERKMEAVHCQILEDAGQSFDIVGGCEICHDHIWHPVGKFRCGLPKKRYEDHLRAPWFLTKMAAGELGPSAPCPL